MITVFSLKSSLCGLGLSRSKAMSLLLIISDLPLRLYLWKVVKNSSRAERLSCAAAMIALLTCVGLIVYFTINAKDTSGTSIDVAPHEWNISRDMWLAQWGNNTLRYVDPFVPVRLVIVQHTVSTECDRFVICAAELRTLQSFFLRNKDYDIPYNFMIGNDGRVYEGRGWGMVGAHTFGYNRCALGLGFIGDYREELQYHAKVSELQLNRTMLMLEEGIRRGFIHPDYYIIGANDVGNTDSPGSNLHKALQEMEHYDHKRRFRHKTCEEIYELIVNE